MSVAHIGTIFILSGLSPEVNWVALVGYGDRVHARIEESIVLQLCMPKAVRSRSRPFSNVTQKLFVLVMRWGSITVRNFYLHHERARWQKDSKVERCESVDCVM